MTARASADALTTPHGEVAPFYDAIAEAPLGPRARSALDRASRAPETREMTFQAYFCDAGRFFGALGRLSNVGKGTLSEIDDAVSRVVECTPALAAAAGALSGATLRAVDPPDDDRRSVAAALPFFQTLARYEHSRRLQNALEAAARDWPGPASLLDYIDDVGGLRRRFLRRANVGRTTRAELVFAIRRILADHTDMPDPTNAGIGSDVVDPRPEPGAEPDPVTLVTQMLDELKSSEANVLRHRFGLTGETPLNLRVIAADLGLTRERVRQIQVGALARLGHPSRRAPIVRSVDAHGPMLASLLGPEAGTAANEAAPLARVIARETARLAVMIAHGSESEWRVRLSRG